MARGAFGFETAADTGELANTATNVEKLRSLWSHHSLIMGEDLGPGDRGDFDVGSWHVGCHLAGAGAVRRAKDGALVWLEISHDPIRDEYYASASVRRGASADTLRLDTADARSLLDGSTVLGFVEGNSTGRTSARGMTDAPDTFNLWRRQDFDWPVSSPNDGGKVWEHWCTLRDIRTPNRIGTSVLTAYVALAAAAGDRFIATVARGRRDYGHPVQLAAMVYAGLTTARAATWNVTPAEIPKAAEPLFNEAQPARALDAIHRLPWGRTPQYYMFARRIKSWSKVKDVEADLKKQIPQMQV
jgi:hypothetical protein